MFRILIRQLLKHWKALIPLSLVWLAGGYYFFSPNHDWLRQLLAGKESPDTIHIPTIHDLFRWSVRSMVSTPEAGSENPARAYDHYVKPALENLEVGGGSFACALPEFLGGGCEAPGQIRLDLMEKGCHRLPTRMTISKEYFRPHWLELSGKWNPAPVQPDGIRKKINYPVEPDAYWEDHIQKVLDSLRYLVDGLNFAYRIPGDVVNPGKPGQSDGILIPELIDRLGRAACVPFLGPLAWGDYADFLEEKAYVHSTRRTIGPGEKWILLYEGETGEMKDYILALKNFRAGVSPDPFSDTGCDGGKFQLSCYAPEQALEANYRLLSFTPASEQTPIFLELGRIHLSLYRKTGEAEHRKLAMDYLIGAMKSFDTEREARILVARQNLIEKDYRSALRELLALELLYKKRGRRDPVFNSLAHSTLQGLGFFREADCFSPLQEIPIGRRESCDHTDLMEFLK